jgi:hypothetical protein
MYNTLYVQEYHLKLTILLLTIMSTLIELHVNFNTPVYRLKTNLKKTFIKSLNVNYIHQNNRNESWIRLEMKFELHLNVLLLRLARVMTTWCCILSIPGEGRDRFSDLCTWNWPLHCMPLEGLRPTRQSRTRI